MSSDYSMVLSTFPDRDSAKAAAKLLVERRLAACVQVFPIESVYVWNGEVCDSGEVMLFIKAKAALYDKIQAAIKEVHDYEVPEIIKLPVAAGLPEYLRWIDESCDQ